MGNASTVQPLGVQPLLEVIGDFQIVQVGKGRVGVAHVRQIFCCARFLPRIEGLLAEELVNGAGVDGKRTPGYRDASCPGTQMPLRKAFQTPRSLAEVGWALASSLADAVYPRRG